MAYDSSTVPYDTFEDAVDADDTFRSLYSGDISSSILQKFAAFYRDHMFSPFRSVNDSYFCIRSNASEYKFYVGNIDSDGKIHSATVVTYRGVTTGGSYNTHYEWSEATASSGYIDLDGYSGYIYSSYSGYSPNPYISQYSDSAYTAFFSLTLTVCVIFFGLVSALRRFFKHGQ